MMIFLIFLLLLSPGLLTASERNFVDLVESHARSMAKGQQGEIRIEIGTIDRQRLAPCNQAEAYTPSGARAIGRSHVGLRCISGSSWQILVPVRIAVINQYLVTARPVSTGKIIDASDIALRSGDLAMLPNGVLLDPTQAIGKISRSSLGAGQVLRADHVRVPFVVKQGQTVKVISRGDGFAVSAEGKSTVNAGVGELAKIRMLTGKTLTGIVQEDGTIIVSN